MERPPHEDRELYDNRQKAISKANREQKASGGEQSWNSFVRQWHLTSEKPGQGSSRRSRSFSLLFIA